MSSSWTLHLVPLFLLLLPVATGSATFNITNRCPHTLWRAAVPVGGGRQLDPGESWILNMPAGITGGRVWARTGCSFDRAGNGKCKTGDYSGVLACTGYGQAPNTMAEFTLGQINNTAALRRVCRVGDVAAAVPGAGDDHRLYPGHPRVSVPLPILSGAITHFWRV
jgi:hypothetical protein